MATPDTASPSSPFLEEMPSPKSDMMQMKMGDTSHSYLVQEHLSLQEHLAQQQDQTMNASSYVCEWMPTNVRLPSSQNSQQDEQVHLCLPVHLSESSYFKQNEEKEEYKDDGYCSDTATRLRLMALDHYLARVSPLALSAKKLLYNTSTSEDTGGNTKLPKTSLFKAFQNKCQRRSKRDRQSQLPSNQTKHTSTTHRLITSTNSGRVMNVLQGEIAHCTPSQADTLVSDDATTCHIVALWSCYQGASEGSTALAASKNVLATLTHIDGVGYEASIRDAVNEHIKYHSMHNMASSTEEYKEDANHGTIEMSIHMMGGFNDDDGSSIEITDNVLQTFAALSNECNMYFMGTNIPRINMSLETCAVSSANDDGNCCPLGRGLGIEVATGKVFLAEVEDINDPKGSSGHGMRTVAKDGKMESMCHGNSNVVQSPTSSAEGPGATLRSTRLWASAFHSYGAKQQKRLYVIHQFSDDCMSIEPFFFAPHRDARRLLDLGDEELLSITSTSPDVEKSNFVSKVRQSLTYLNETRSKNVFFAGQPMKFKRVGLNGWVRVG
jgi:hypothetical protein